MEELIQKLSEQMAAMNGALEKGFAESKEVQEGLAERLREVERTNRSQSETVERPKGAIASPAKSSTPSTMTTTSNTTTHRGRTSRKSFLAEQHELFSIAEQEQDLGEQNDEEVDETTQIRVARYVSNIARNIGGHTGQEDDHASWVDTLVSEFTVNWLSQIVSDDENVWQQYRRAKPEKAELQDRVMVSVLNGAIKKGTVWAKFRTARTSRPTDGRGIFIAIKEAHSQTGYRQSRRKLKSNLRKLQYDPDEDYGIFKLKFTEATVAFSKLQSRKGVPCTLTAEDEVDYLLMKFEEAEGGLDEDERARWTSIFTNMEMGLDDDDELEVDDIHSRVELELQAQRQSGDGEPRRKRDNHRGRSQAQRNVREDEQGNSKPSQMRCTLCKEEDHWARDCPAKEAFKLVPCPRQRGKYGCKFGDLCYYKHKKKGDAISNKDEDVNMGVNATMQGDAASLAAEMALKKKEYDAVRVKVGSLSQQTYSDMYQPNQGSAGAGSGATPYYGMWASQ